VHKSLVIVASALALAFGTAAQALTVTDATGDFIGTYTGPHQADLDVTSFSVTYSSATNKFLLQSTMAGDINSALPGFYAIGVNTGLGKNNFAAIGFEGVRFDTVISVQKAGTATIGGVSIGPNTVTIGGNALSVMLDASLLTSTGFDPAHYSFNIWPRSGTVGGTAVISDFAPENRTVSSLEVSGVPEPATWAMMVLGFGLCGFAARASRKRVVFA